MATVRISQNNEIISIFILFIAYLILRGISFFVTFHFAKFCYYSTRFLFAFVDQTNTSELREEKTHTKKYDRRKDAIDRVDRPKLLKK